MWTKQNASFEGLYYKIKDAICNPPTNPKCSSCNYGWRFCGEVCLRLLQNVLIDTTFSWVLLNRTKERIPY